MRLAPEELEARDCPAITIRLDYTYDTSNFFNTQAKRDAMQRAADALDSRLQDNFTAIVPNPAAGRTWTAFTSNTLTGATISLVNPTINANEIVIFVAGGVISGSAIGIASSGGYNTGPFPLGSDWPSVIKGRGQSGALGNTDFAPWGGFIGFDSSVNWNFNASAPSFSQTDFESVALHELLHVLGFGLENVASFARYISGSTFVGPNAVASYGGAVPLDAGGHVAAGVTSNGQTAIMVPSIPNGTERVVTPLDFAVLKDIGWDVSTPVVPPPPPPPTGAAGPVRFHVGSGVGHEPLVAGLNANGGTVWNAVPFDSSFTGGVRVASGDFNDDGVLDVAVGTGPGITARVRVINGATKGILFDTNPFGTFNGGVYVAAGDITGDGRDDLLISPDRGGGPRVRIFQGNGFTQVSDWFGIDDVNFRGGARVATGDINGDGRDDVIVSAGFGGGPRVALFDGKQLGLNGGPKFLGDFFAFETSLRNGSFISAGDVNGDGFDDLLAGGGPGGGPRVRGFSGKALVNDQQTVLVDFFAGNINSRGGVNLASYDRTNDGRDEILAGTGEGSGSTIALFDAATIISATPSPLFSSNYFGDNGGIFVG